MYPTIPHMALGPAWKCDFVFRRSVALDAADKYRNRASRSDDGCDCGTATENARRFGPGSATATAKASRCGRLRAGAPSARLGSHLPQKPLGRLIRTASYRRAAHGSAEPAVAGCNL